MSTKKASAKKRSTTTAKAKGSALAKSSTAGVLSLSMIRAQIAEYVKRGDTEGLRDLHAKAKGVEEYVRERTRERGDGLEAQGAAAEAVLRIERGLGDLLAEQVKPGNLSKSSKREQFAKLSDLGITRKQSKRWQDFARMDEETFDDLIATVRAKVEHITTTGSANAPSDAKDYDGDEWGTPPEYIALAREVLEEIDLDPASNDHAQTVVLAKAHFTKKDNGLEQHWAGRVWLNPPYSHPDVERFTSKLLSSYQEGDVEAALCLVNNATDAEWCQQMLAHASAVCFVNGRIGFLDGQGHAVKGTRQGQVFFYLGPDVAAFEAVFGDVGAVLKP